MKRPSFQFYTGDWMKDPALSMCSPMSRGIWIDVLCLMHEQDGGELSGTIEQLSRALRCNVDELTRAIEELSVTKAGHVTQKNGIVTLMSRRMMRDKEQRVQWRERQNNKRRKGRVTRMSRECHAPSSSSSSSSSTNTKRKHIVSDAVQNPQLPYGSVPPEGVQPTRKKFVRPALTEVAEYMRQRGWRDWEALSKKWWDSYEAKGWRVGRTQTPMRDWRAAVRTWEGGDDVVIEQRADEAERYYEAPCGVCGAPGRGRIEADGRRVMAMCEKCYGEMQRELDV